MVKKTIGIVLLLIVIPWIIWSVDVYFSRQARLNEIQSALEATEFTTTAQVIEFCNQYKIKYTVSRSLLTISYYENDLPLFSLETIKSKYDELYWAEVEMHLDKKSKQSPEQ